MVTSDTGTLERETLLTARFFCETSASKPTRSHAARQPRHIKENQEGQRQPHVSEPHARLSAEKSWLQIVEDTLRSCVSW